MSREKPNCTFDIVPATHPNYGKPYLAPWDTLRYIPRSTTLLSRLQNKFFHLCEVKRGWLLVTCSGRNLGPVVMVDEFLAKFAVSGDMIRVTSPLNDDLFYVFAFLSTATGRHLLRGGGWGSVVDHIHPKDVRNIPVPMADERTRRTVVNAFVKAMELREQARPSLLQAEQEFLRLSGLRAAVEALPLSAYRRRFQLNASQLKRRLDVEPHAPLYQAYREAIRSTGMAAHLSEVGKVFRPPGRYKTVYVENPQYGIPILSGRQVAQYRPVGLKFISPASFRRPDDYLLEHNTLVLTADGRAEENLADCGVVTRDRAGWAASGHVIRIIPQPGIHVGLLYLACTCQPVQAQMKALATGSVVDALSEDDVSDVLLLYPGDSEWGRNLAKQVVDAWNRFVDANSLEDSAIKLLESYLGGD